MPSSFFAHKVCYGDLIEFEDALGNLHYYRVLSIDPNYGFEKLFIKAYKENIDEVPIPT